MTCGHDSLFCDHLHRTIDDMYLLGHLSSISCENVATLQIKKNVFVLKHANTLMAEIIWLDAFIMKASSVLIMKTPSVFYSVFIMKTSSSDK